MIKLILLFLSNQKKLCTRVLELHELSVSRGVVIEDLNRRIQTYLEIIEREKGYNLNKRIKRRNKYWRDNNTKLKF